MGAHQSNAFAFQIGIDLLPWKTETFIDLSDSCRRFIHFKEHIAQMVVRIFRKLFSGFFQEKPFQDCGER